MPGDREIDLRISGEQFECGVGRHASTALDGLPRLPHQIRPQSVE
jgi:hypothetical protein